jgi:hypothetical protein
MNSLAIKSSNEIQPLIDAIERHGQEDIGTTGAIALINLILYAGAPSLLLLERWRASDDSKKSAMFCRI